MSDSIAMRAPDEYMIVGCGGVASYFFPSFFRTVNHMFPKTSLPRVTIVDGDMLEEKNLARQQFSSFDPIKKVDAIERMYETLYGRKISKRKTYFSGDEMVDENTMIFCFADNHLCRRHVLEAVDAGTGCSAICAANSTISSHAYIYLPQWRGGPLDPRVRFPEIETDETDSPLKIGDCNSEVVLNDTPQTALANTMASSCSLLLWNLWCNEIPKMGEIERDDFERLPVEFFNSGSSMGRITIKELKELNL